MIVLAISSGSFSLLLPFPAMKHARPPGIGPVLASGIVAEIGAISRFEQSKLHRGSHKVAVSLSGNTITGLIDKQVHLTYNNHRE